VVDGVYSMEGDVAPLPEILKLTKQYGARLMVDEAHAFGVLGERGAGSCELFGVEDDVDLRMATFSKSLASCGGVIAGSQEVIEFLRIASRPFIFTASGVPAAVGAALAAVRICRSAEGPSCSQRCSRTPPTCAAAWPSSASACCRSRGCPTAPRSSRPWSQWWSATTGRPSSSGRPSMRPASFVNVAIHPAVPPAGALLRTSVMATHDTTVLDEALEIFKQSKQAFEAEHGPLPVGN